ncbi:DUF5641 domain-containing protein [Trichonephila clavipes]|nr:DUF5641 domain-containing protein [Trichonephila clavipes]
MAGPLLTKSKQKAWIILFTRAVFRAVHLELITSLSTTDFIQAMRRFIARRGRISVMYSDNGTNFTGLNNALRQLDWTTIESEFRVHEILIKREDKTNEGDIVLIGTDDKKRLHWLLGRVLELFPGKDGIIRLVKLRTERGDMLRPIQRLYPLEVTSNQLRNL